MTGAAAHRPTGLRTELRGGKSAFAALAVIAAGAMLASCALAPTPSKRAQTKEYFSQKEYGVSASPRMVALGDPIPKGGGRYHVGKPYKVKGKVYKPRANPDYSAVGLASWYGGAFHGRKTANGEIYDMGELTAAHPTLPLPSYARVTNLANDRSVIVRVNDRGPFARGRIIDVSATVAEMLDFKRAGTAKVKVEYVGTARMDGLDRQMLVSSYKGPNDFGHDTLFASTVTPKPRNDVVLASLTPPKERNGRTAGKPDRSIDLFGAQRLDAPVVVAPAFMPATYSGGDPLGPLILRTGFASSYAPVGRFSRAHLAAAELAVAAREPALVQIGTFGDRMNAERAAARFGAFGRVETLAAASAERTLHVVRVAVDRSLHAPEEVVAAARAAGIADAFIVSR